MNDKKTDSLPSSVQVEKTPDEKSRGQITQSKANSASNSGTQDNSTFEEYLFGRGVLIEGAKNQAWSDTTKGRVMIRLVSRGLVGAAAFALGNRYATEQLRGYLPTGKFDEAKPLQWVARGFDNVFGRSISTMAHFAAAPDKKMRWARDSVWFRSKAYYHGTPDNPISGLPSGRSLGAEMVAISFDFACASVGDATTRNIIQAFDPNIQKPWIKDGKFDANAWVNSVGRATWRILTKNAGEDWGVALPYVYQMRWQRQALAKLWPGFKLTSDQAWNGGSFSIIKNHKGIFQIHKDYQLAGALDLQCRFVGYNWYTLMYRDAYDAIGRGLKKWQQNGYSLDVDLPENPISAAVGSFGHTLRYIAKSWVKSNLYMQPATPFFWMFRTPQSKWRATPIHPYGTEETGGYLTREPIARNGGSFQNTAEHRVIPAGIFTKGTHEGKNLYLGEQAIFSRELKYFDPFAIKNQKTVFGAILNPLGALSYHTGSMAVHYLEPLIAKSKSMNKVFGNSNFARETMLRSMIDASYSYTPYMIAKAEFGLRVDDRPAGGGLGEMDKAIYGAIDSFFTFKFKDLGKYTKRIGELMNDNTQKEVISREGNPEKVVGDGSVIPNMSKDPSTRVEKSSVVEEHKEALTGNPKSQKSWKHYIADKREVAQLHPTHPTVQ